LCKRRRNGSKKGSNRRKLKMEVMEGSYKRENKVKDTVIFRKNIFSGLKIFFP
jgi:hypothetical protein